MANVFTQSEAEAGAKHYPEMKLWHANLAKGAEQEFNWVKFEVGSIYPLHSHPYEQTSFVISGRIRLTVGDEVREVGPGDMWFVPSNVPHGGELLGDEPFVFIETYSPPSAGDDSDVTYHESFGLKDIAEKP